MIAHGGGNEKVSEVRTCLVGSDFFCLGILFQTAFSYIFVETLPVDTTEALALFNKKFERDEQHSMHAHSLIFTSEPECNPVILGSIEKHCVQTMVLVFTDDTVLEGFCDT